MVECVGVVTVTYNSGQVIDDFLASLLAQTYSDFRLYVVDNASADDSLKRIAAYPDPRVIVIANPDNRGIAAGNNQGIEAALNAGCSHVLLLNNDTVFAPQLVEQLLASLNTHQCDMIVPKMMYYDAKNKLWCAGGILNAWRAYTGQHYGDGEIDSGQYDVAKQIDYCPTCCMLIKKSVFAAIGLMDEKYFVYVDDTDFCYRALKAHLRMFYTPDAKLLHKVSSLTGSTHAPFTIRMLTRNKIYFIRKHFNLPLKIFWLSLYESSLLLRWFSGKDNFKLFSMKQKAFREGLSL